MVLKRKIYQKLLDWKRVSRGKSAMLIKGARRVGKSFICELFGKNEYKSMIFIDFSYVDDAIRNIFIKDSPNLDLFFDKISAYYRIMLYKRESLFVFDEVQQFPRARQLIKYLVADGKYDYIETGSLISLKQNVKDILIPSEEDSLDMYPLDFEEFLWAIGDEVTLPYLRDCFEHIRPLGQAVHRRVMGDFRQYLLVGGMPDAVMEYTTSRDMAAVDLAKHRILALYRSDIGKFAGRHEAKVSAIFDAIPGQLSKKGKKYKLSAVSKNARSRRYEGAFVWLEEAMVINPCYSVTDPAIGLALSSDYTVQKIYLADTGLLITHTFSDKRFIDNDLYRAILFDKLGINEGMIMENAVAQMLRCNGHRLFFYARHSNTNSQDTMEIDFLISKDRKITPIEVKSSSYVAHSSLDKFRRKFSSKLGNSYILYTRDVMVKEGVIHLPLYMAMLL